MDAWTGVQSTAAQGRWAGTPARHAAQLDASGLATTSEGFVRMTWCLAPSSPCTAQGPHLSMTKAQEDEQGVGVMDAGQGSARDADRLQLVHEKHLARNAQPQTPQPPQRLQQLQKVYTASAAASVPQHAPHAGMGMTCRRCGRSRHCKSSAHKQGSLLWRQVLVRGEDDHRQRSAAVAKCLSIRRLADLNGGIRHALEASQIQVLQQRQLPHKVYAAVLQRRGCHHVQPACPDCSMQRNSTGSLYLVPSWPHQACTCRTSCPAGVNMQPSQHTGSARQSAGQEDQAACRVCRGMHLRRACKLPRLFKPAELTLGGVKVGSHTSSCSWLMQAK